MAKVTREKLRKLIRASMSERGIRYINGSEGLAAAAGITRNTIYNWEGGSTVPALDELERVAIVLAIPLSALVDAWSGRQPEEAASPNYWARRLQQDTAAISDLLAELSDLMAAEAGVAETMPQPSDDEAGGADPEDDPDVAGQPSKHGQS